VFSDDRIAIQFNASQQRAQCEVLVHKPAQLQAVAMSITCVLESASGLTYFALTHRGEQADFHRHDSFVLAFN